jgi:IS605 OrfB family transposase
MITPKEWVGLLPPTFEPEGRRERRFAADTNHVISKGIVAEAERTSRGIALENLQGIRTRARLRKPQRAAVHSWAFAQLGAFIG